MQVTESNKQEAEKVANLYHNNMSFIQSAIINRQSVLEAFKQLFPLQSYDDELILVRKCKDIIEQITYLKSKI